GWHVFHSRCGTSLLMDGDGLLLAVGYPPNARSSTVCAKIQRTCSASHGSASAEYSVNDRAEMQSKEGVGFTSSLETDVEWHPGLLGIARYFARVRPVAGGVLVRIVVGYAADAEQREQHADGQNSPHDFPPFREVVVIGCRIEAADSRYLQRSTYRCAF